MEQEKTCNECGTSKPLADFYKDVRYDLGVKSVCKVCYLRKTGAYGRSDRGRAVKTKYDRSERGQKRGREYRQTDRAKEMNRERLRRHHQTEKGKITRQKHVKIYKEKFPERNNAHQVLSDAVRHGKIDKPSICSTPDKDCHGRIEGHHKDYSKPLEVTWLCRYHHDLLRLKKRNQKNESGSV